MLILLNGVDYVGNQRLSVHEVFLVNFASCIDFMVILIHHFHLLLNNDQSILIHYLFFLTLCYVLFTLCDKSKDNLDF